MVAIIDADSLIFASAYNQESLEEAIDLFNSKLEFILEDLEQYCVVTNVIICSGGSNASRLALNKSYKANRTKDKPQFLSALHKEVKDSYNSLYAEGHETDDVVASVWQNEVDKNGEDSVIIVGIDKDYKQFPCWFFDTYWKRRKLDKIEYFEAKINFYTQMIVGDTADNVNYFKGKGKAYARKLFSGVFTEYGLFRRVYGLFLDEYVDDAKDKFLECYNILKLKTNIYAEIRNRE